MKHAALLVVFMVSLVMVIRCTKTTSTPTKNPPTCTTCNGALLVQTPDSVTGLWYYLPTAFTPNGDGINDVFRLYYNDKLDVDSSTITIWDKSGNGVYEGNINQTWNGKNLKGVLCAAGHYPLYLKLRTKTGQQINQCGCVSILTFKGTCIFTGGVKYYMPDQMDTATGFTNATMDDLCP